MTGPTTELHVTFAACEGISAARRRLTEDEVFDELLGDPGLPRKDLGPALPGWSAVYHPSLGIAFAVKGGDAPLIALWSELRELIRPAAVH